MSLSDHVKAPTKQYDKVEAAYDGMDAADKAVFRGLIQDNAYGHQEIARLLCEVGFDIDRYQVFSFREKLRLGRVKL